MYSVSSAFTSSPISLLATIKPYAFSCIACTLPPNILTSSAQIRSWSVPFHFKPSLFTWALLLAYFKAKLKSNTGRSSPCFKPFLIENMSDKFLPTWTLLYFHSDTFLYSKSVAYPRIFYGGEGFNKFSWGQRTEKRGSGGGSPLVRGSGGSCNLVQEIWYIYLAAIGLTPGGSSTAHIYTQTVHRIQRTEHT